MSVPGSGKQGSRNAIHVLWSAYALKNVSDKTGVVACASDKKKLGS